TDRERSATTPSASREGSGAPRIRIDSGPRRRLGGRWRRPWRRKGREMLRFGRLKKGLIAVGAVAMGLVGLADATCGGLPNGFRGASLAEVPVSVLAEAWGALHGTQIRRAWKYAPASVFNDGRGEVWGYVIRGRTRWWTSKDVKISTYHRSTGPDRLEP